jgi:pilus assembly protein Flp/PilA
MLKHLWNLVKDENGQSMVEYGLIIALIAIVIVGVLAAMGGSLQAVFQRITGTLEDLPAAEGGN